MNGPTGLMIGAARGVVRSMHCNPDFPADILPVDVAINAIITAAWERGQKQDNNTVDFMNVVSINYNVFHFNWKFYCVLLLLSLSLFRSRRH